MKFKKVFAPILVAVLALLLIASTVMAAWSFAFPISVVDTGGSDRAYVPVLTGITGTSLSSAGYMNATGTDTNMQIGSSSIPYMLSTTQVATVAPSLYAGSQVTYNLYTGYDPAQTAFSIVTGTGGYITTSDDADLELADDFTVDMKGYVDTDSGSDKNLVHKEEAFRVWVSGDEEILAGIVGSLSGYSSSSDGEIVGSGAVYAIAQAATTGIVSDSPATFNFGQSYASNSETQTSLSSFTNLYGGSVTRSGERVNDFEGILTSAQWSLQKVYSPTGTAYCRIYRVSDDALLGTMGTLDVSTLTTSPAWKTFNSTPVSIDSPTDIRICLEYSGGDSVNNIKMGYQNSNVTAWGIRTSYTGSWNDEAARDAGYQVNYTVYQVDKGFVFFDTSSIPDDAEIGNASLYLYGSSDSSDTDFNIVVTNGQPTYPTDPLAAGDFDKTHYSGTGNDTFSTADFSVAGYNELTLDSTGLGWIDVDGTTKLCIRSSRDIAATTPTGDEYVAVYASEETGTSKDPYLEVYYYAPSLTATGITSGLRRVVIEADTTDLTLSVYDGADVLIDSDTAALSGASVPGNANDYVWGQNDVAPYWTYIKMTTAIGGSSEKLWYQPTAMVLGDTYSTGTATFTNGSDAVEGSGTTWTSDMEGSMIKSDVDDVWHVVSSVTDSTNLTLTANYSGTGGSDHDYNMEVRLIDRDTGDGSQDGALTWGSNSDMTVTMDSVVSFESASSTAGETGGHEIIDADIPGGWYGDSSISDLPLYDNFSEISVDTGIPVRTLYIIGIFSVAIALGFGVFLVFKPMIFGFIASLVVVWAGSSMGVVPGWIVLSYAIAGFGIVYLRRQM